MAYENHKPGFGEDAQPIWMFYSRPDSGLVGALDGLGGAGGALIKLDEGKERTGAWVASRLTREVVRTVYEEMIRQRDSQWPSRDSDEAYNYDEVNGSPGPVIRNSFDFTARVQEEAKAELTDFAAQKNAGGSGRLRSKMIKTLPTTLAMASYDLGKREYFAIWAGDSRVYCLHPEQGLQQATTDDLKTNADAMENLTADALMSNLVSASEDFVLHERKMTLPQRCVLLAATDGCFGYVQTPLHFEYLLLSSMQQARDWKEWEELLEREITQITEDDSTLSAAIIGWPDFAAFRAEYTARFNFCDRWVRFYASRSVRVDALEQDLKQAREELAAAKRQLWENYRETYERLGAAPVRDVPLRRDGNPKQERGDPSARPQRAEDKPRHAEDKPRHEEEHTGDDGGET